MSEPTVRVELVFEGIASAESSGLIVASVRAFLDHAYKVGGASAMYETVDAIRKVVDEHPLVVEKVKPE